MKHHRRWWLGLGAHFSSFFISVGSSTGSSMDWSCVAVLLFGFSYSLVWRLSLQQHLFSQPFWSGCPQSPEKKELGRRGLTNKVSTRNRCSFLGVPWLQVVGACCLGTSPHVPIVCSSEDPRRSLLYVVLACGGLTENNQWIAIIFPPWTDVKSLFLNWR